MKVWKRFSYLLLIVVLLGSQVALPDFVPQIEAKSLKDLRQELAYMEKKYEENKKEQQATQAEIDKANANIKKLTKEKMEIEADIDDLTASIEQTNKDIAAKNEEIKDIIAYYQLSATGEDAYLEYVFTATDFTDFIYRMAIAEQLSDYNDSLIEEYQNLILENEEKKETLSNKVVELNSKTKELEKTLASLKVDLSKTVEGAVDIETELKTIRKNLENYEKTYKEFKCDESEDYQACLARHPDQLPPDTAFFRPVISGRVSSNYGMRTYWLNGQKLTEGHAGIDFAVPHNTNVYSVAAGRVVAIYNKLSCGGNQVYIAHTVNGKKYTSGYMHLASIKVKVGDVVTSDTVIGKSGGVPSIETWDHCSTGGHVHLQMATGHYMIDYLSWSGYSSRTFNPRNVVNAPALGKSFTSRTRKY